MMTIYETPHQLEKLLRLNEGERLKPYQDTAGKLTIGVGRNLTDCGVSQVESDYLLANDIQHAAFSAAGVIGDDVWPSIGVARQAALIDMAFNMGAAKLMEFRAMIAAIRGGEWEAAANEALNSRWAAMVGQRALRASEMLRTGKWPQEVE